MWGGWMMFAGNEIYATGMTLTCSGPACIRPARASRNPPLCPAHYYQVHRRGKALAPLRALQRDTACSGPQCDRPARARGLCKTHYDQRIRGSELSPIGSMVGKHPRLGSGRRCTAIGCEREATIATSYCLEHAKEDRRMRHFYGIGWAEHDELCVAQNWLCAICGSPRSLHVDHDHQSGQVRGMLCGACNRAIGLFGHDEATLLAAARYVALRG